jgi:hypothetical protein
METKQTQTAKSGVMLILAIIATVCFFVESSYGQQSTNDGRHNTEATESLKGATYKKTYVIDVDSVTTNTVGETSEDMMLHGVDRITVKINSKKGTVKIVLDDFDQHRVLKLSMPYNGSATQRTLENWTMKYGEHLFFYGDGNGAFRVNSWAPDFSDQDPEAQLSLQIDDCLVNFKIFGIVDSPYANPPQ